MANTDNLPQLRRQLEFYFSNANLRRDRFMTTKIGENAEGFVSIEVLLTFNRLLTLGATPELIVEAVSGSDKIRLSEDKSSIARVTPFSAEDETDSADDRTIFLNHIDQESTIDSLTEMMSAYGTVLIVRMPRLKTFSKNDTRKIDGTAFVEFESVDSVAKVLEALPRPAVKPVGNEPRTLYALSIPQWKERKEEKKKERNTRKRHAPVHVRGNLVRMTGISTQVTKPMMFTAMEAIKAAKYVDLKAGADNAIVRFPTAEDAQAVVTHLTENEVVLAESRLAGSIVGAEEEQSYWNAVQSAMKHGGPKPSRRSKRDRDQPKKEAVEAQPVAKKIKADEVSKIKAEVKEPVVENKENQPTTTTQTVTEAITSAPETTA